LGIRGINPGINDLHMRNLSPIRNAFLAILISMIPLICLDGQQSNFEPCSLPVDWSNIKLNLEGQPESPARMLIVTNRLFNAEDANDEPFSNDLSEFREVTYLLACCEEGTWQLFPVDDLNTGLSQIDNGNDILLFVHGHGKNLPLVLTRSNQIQERYGVSLLVFDWPSKNSNFNKSLSRVRRCGENFYNLLLQIKEYRQEKMEAGQHLSLLMHSLGNYFITHMVVNGNNQYMEEKIFDNIIMNAAAVRAKEHVEVISRLKIQDRIYVVYNNSDRVLRGAHLLTVGKMLGNLPLDPLAPNASYVDFSLVAGSEHTYFAGYHQFEEDLPAIKHFYRGAFHGEDVDLSNPSLFTTDENKKIYQVND